jgi:hypothetical protein
MATPPRWTKTQFLAWFEQCFPKLIDLTSGLFGAELKACGLTAEAALHTSLVRSLRLRHYLGCHTTMRTWCQPAPRYAEGAVHRAAARALHRGAAMKPVTFCLKPATHQSESHLTLLLAGDQEAWERWLNYCDEKYGTLEEERASALAESQARHAAREEKARADIEIQPTRQIGDIVSTNRREGEAGAVALAASYSARDAHHLRGVTGRGEVVRLALHRGRHLA